MTTLEAALDYAARGLPVFPVYPVVPFRGRFVCKCFQTVRCSNPGKHPMTRHGLKDATTDAVATRERWACAPDANLGIACSRTCVVLDVDPRHGGDVTLDQLQRRHGALPMTWTAKTGGGGWHYFFTANQEVRNNAGKLGDGLDIRGTGGYVVAPPSVHVSGNRYSWAPGRAPADVPLAAMPEWLVAATRSQISGKAVATPTATWRELVRYGVGEGARNHTIARLYGHLLRRDVDPVVALELVTTWNAVRCRPPLPEAEVVAVAANIAERDDKRREEDPHGR
jgi:hypothetical protein